MRIDRVYTRGGDKGETSLIGGERVSKADARLECYGTADELNAVHRPLRRGARRNRRRGDAPDADPSPRPERAVQPRLRARDARSRNSARSSRASSSATSTRSSATSTRSTTSCPPLKSFVLPGGGWASAYFHLARTVCRPRERLVVALAQHEDIGAHGRSISTGSPTRCSCGAAGARSRTTRPSRSGTREHT